MPGIAKYLLIVSMDVDPAHEALFNEVYDREHIPNLSRVPGVLRITRYTRQELIMNLGGERRTMRAENEPAYTGRRPIRSERAPDNGIATALNTVPIMIAVKAKVRERFKTVVT